MGWQLRALDRIFCDVEGSWAAPTALISVGRQNGKTTLMENAIGWLLTDYAQEVGRPISVLSTAHELDLAVESFLELADVLKELYGAKVTYAYGRNQVLMPDGSLWKVKASTGKKHGGTWDFIFADEIWALSEAALFGALKPSQIAVPNPLMVLLSTAGDESSTAFLQLREQALSAIEKGEPTDLTMLEWSVPPGCGLEEQFWGMANPALGTTITMQGLRSAFNGPDKTAFARAHLNQWVSAAGSWLGPGLWDTLQTDQPMPPGGVLAVDCSIDNSRYVGVRASSENGIVHLAVEFTTASESEMWQEVTRVMRSSSTVVLGITPALAIHIPKEFVRRNKLWGYKEILTFTGLVRNMIVEERVRHRGETILAEHVNRAVMTKTVQGAVLSSQKSPGPIELTRAMVYAVAMASKSQAPKPFVAVAGG
jgi:phage terminase large subunit-like protein